jgi:hypothetical protein
LKHLKKSCFLLVFSKVITLYCIIFVLSLKNFGATQELYLQCNEMKLYGIFVLVQKCIQLDILTVAPNKASTVGILLGEDGVDESLLLQLATPQHQLRPVGCSTAYISSSNLLSFERNVPHIVFVNPTLLYTNQK